MSAGSRLLALLLLTLVPLMAAAQAPSALRAVTTDDGVWLQEGDTKVLFYQRRPKSQNGRYTRANYVHPLLGLDGETLTEDFPPDHPHQRGIFWAWHQVTIGGKTIGDPWALKDCSWDIRDVKTEATDGAVSLRTTVHWLSPLWKDENGMQKPFVRERARIRVHKAEPARRMVDFEIALTALEPELRIGGAAPTPGYGGFSPRLRLPKDVRFLGPRGEVQPLPGPVDPSPWIDLAGTLAQQRTSGVAMLTHPTTPGFPQPWILRRERSMQNPVYPGATPVLLSTERPLVLCYRLVLHRGAAAIEQIDRWQQEYAQAKDR
jgi:hypothetical protein